MQDKKQNTTFRIQFLQQNVDKNDNKMHTCLQIDLELNIDFVVFQELFININLIITISHLAYYYIILKSEKVRFRVIIFARKNLRF